MKLSKEELLKKVSERVTDEELSIELMEDISDSMEVSDVSAVEVELETTREKLEEMKYKYNSLQQRFKERFFEGPEDPEEPEVNDDIENVIDIKEI